MDFKYRIPALIRKFVGNKKLRMVCFLPLVLLGGCVISKYSDIDVQMDLPKNFTSTNLPLQQIPINNHDLEELKVEANRVLAPLGFSFVPPGPSQAVNSGQYEVEEWHYQMPSNWFWGSRSYEVDMINSTRTVGGDMINSPDTVVFTVITDDKGSENEIKKVTAAMTVMMQEKFPDHPFKVSFHRLTTIMPP